MWGNLKFSVNQIKYANDFTENDNSKKYYCVILKVLNAFSVVIHCPDRKADLSSIFCTTIHVSL